MGTGRVNPVLIPTRFRPASIGSDKIQTATAFRKPCTEKTRSPNFQVDPVRFRVQTAINKRNPDLWDDEWMIMQKDWKHGIRSDSLIQQVFNQLHKHESINTKINRKENLEKHVDWDVSWAVLAALNMIVYWCCAILERITSNSISSKQTKDNPTTMFSPIQLETYFNQELKSKN